ncbi:DPAGT1 [Cordylochernes scorpioides]|uniref:UDP-N-acetylglucosamine--dolichyl-phosphate N-acetylglucosaminephosphotransferase n=1 Tax=Cordylochernes scorpioides TaxID=51811 RepID=A0ABY6K1Z5_9ARAC|nr:DPAGT1 [Cordylochernes scorpioides]
MFLILTLSILFSIVAYYLTLRLLPNFTKIFIDAGLSGVDQCKPNPQPIPEATGVISSSICLITLFLFIPVPFLHHFSQEPQNFPNHELASLTSALLSICCMMLLGLADDVLNLRWRHKLVLPTVSALPLLVVYYVTYNNTTVIVPWPLRPILGHGISLGPLYYVYMGMMVVFCTNAINIYAGINGLEVGQSLVIAASILLFNLIELSGGCWQAHLFSFYILAPFLATSLALFHYNRYPARMFVGDTFCYFAGMTFSVVGILGHFSKTMMLFFLPQIFNFVFSLPQLFHLVPCPRHRLPRYSKEKDTVDMSLSIFKKQELSELGSLILRIFRTVGLVHVKEFSKDGEAYIECSNFTLIVLILKLFGPMHERTLTYSLILLQIASSCLAFFIRYGLVRIFYEV